MFVDEKGKSVGEGIVDFTRKNNALMAHRFCSDWCYFLTSDLKPVETEVAEMFEMDEGLLEANLTGPQRSGGFRGGRRDEHNLMSSREVLQSLLPFRLAIFSHHLCFIDRRRLELLTKAVLSTSMA